MGNLFRGRYRFALRKACSHSKTTIVPFCHWIILGLDGAQPLNDLARLFKARPGQMLAAEALVRNIKAWHFSQEDWI